MIRFIIHIVLSLCFFTTGTVLGNEKINNDITIETIIATLSNEIDVVENNYNYIKVPLKNEISLMNFHLDNSTLPEKQLELLIRKDQLKRQLKKVSQSELSDISKIRYIKGLQIIKILYEKTLSLDHHFASVSTFREINAISNPNNYPEFASVKEMLDTNKDKKSGFDLSGILGSNIYTSVIHSFVSLFNTNTASKAEKDASLKEIECILDFTLQMNNDLSTIYFETVFLQKNNENIMKDLQQLFVDYTKPIGYKSDLSVCRSTDDWDTVRDNLNMYLKKLNESLSGETTLRKAHRMQIDLEFPIDRLLQFITQYNAFIDQGSKFYEKFAIMLDSYENKQQCASKIPIEYTNLKKRIDVAINKFNTAYKPVEINGSKLKEVLYGINEYD